MPFDRLVRAVDCWAASNGRRDVFAQIGPDAWRPRHIDWAMFLSPAAFRAKVNAADLLVAHAGMGSILTAMEHGKPILVMPRRGSLRETRNDHQVATATRFAAQGRVTVAMDEAALLQQLNELPTVATCRPISRFASPQLINTVRSFICGTNQAPAAPVLSPDMASQTTAAWPPHRA
jgi:UDP-N-acetylglucosamine transferase subunit ALG13